MTRVSDEIFSICEALYNRGEPITQEAIKRAYGKNNTDAVSKYSKAWLEDKGLTKEDLKVYNDKAKRNKGVEDKYGETSVPAGMIRSLEQVVKDTREQIEAEYRPEYERLKALAAAAEEQRDTINADYLSAQKLVEQWQRDFKEKESAFNQLTKEMRALKESHRIAEEQIKRQTDEIKQLKAHAEERIVDLKERISKQEQQYQDQLKLFKEQHTQEINQYRKAKQDSQKAHELTVSNLRKEYQQLDKRHTALEKNYQSLKDEQPSIVRELDQLKHQSKLDDQDKKQLNDQLSHKSNELFDLKASIRVFQAKIDDLVEKNQSLEKRATDELERRVKVEAEMKLLKTTLQKKPAKEGK